MLWGAAPRWQFMCHRFKLWFRKLTLHLMLLILSRTLLKPFRLSLGLDRLVAQKYSQKQSGSHILRHECCNLAVLALLERFGVAFWLISVFVGPEHGTAVDALPRIPGGGLMCPAKLQKQFETTEGPQTYPIQERNVESL